MQFMKACCVLVFTSFCAIMIAGCNQCRVDRDGDGHFSGADYCTSNAPVDCNDNDHTIHPNADEIDNLEDDDCDGIVDERGIFICPDGSQGTAEVTNHIDDDCDGHIDETNDPCDRDGDGVVSDAPNCNGTDCDDHDRRVFPGALEDPFDNINNDCDALTDETIVSCNELPIAPNIPKGVGIFRDCAGTDIENFGRYNYLLQNEPISIPVVIHIFHDDNLLVRERRHFPFSGTPASRKQAELYFYKAMEIVNQDFTPMNLVFKIETINWATELEDIAFSDLAKGNEFETMRERHQVPGKVNMYYVDRNNSSWAGYSSGPHAGEEQMVYQMTRDIFDSISSIHSHEIGHFFDLNHTHEKNLHGLSLADDSLCYETGDRLCDTLPDPGPDLCEVEMEENMCVVTECTPDENGDFYTPDPSNIMSYFSDDCGRTFTNEQKMVMTCSLWRHYPEYIVHNARLQCGEPGCGNGIVEGREECDDGNFNDQDNCSTLCKFNNCGNGSLDEGEECDDGNLANGDSCSNICTIIPLCGDGVTQEGEECDDGNFLNDDWCTNECREPVCGDDFRKAPLSNLFIEEECDDGNLIDGDGCDSECRLEQPPLCGDTFVDEFEQCDIGRFNGDLTSWCSSDCTYKKVDIENFPTSNRTFRTTEEEPMIFEFETYSASIIDADFFVLLSLFQLPFTLYRVEQNNVLLEIESGLLRNATEEESVRWVRMIELPGKYQLKLHEGRYRTIEILDFMNEQREVLGDTLHFFEAHVNLFHIFDSSLDQPATTVNRHQNIMFHGNSEQFFGQTADALEDRFADSTVNLQIHVETDICPDEGLSISFAPSIDLLNINNARQLIAHNRHHSARLIDCENALIRDFPITAFYQMGLKAHGLSLNQSVTIQNISFNLLQAEIPNSVCGNGLIEENEICDLGEQNNNLQSACDSKCTLRTAEAQTHRFEFYSEKIPTDQHDSIIVDVEENGWIGIRLKLLDGLRSLPLHQSRQWPFQLFLQDQNGAIAPEPVFTGETSSVFGDSALVPLGIPGTYQIQIPETLFLTSFSEDLNAIRRDTVSVNSHKYNANLIYFRLINSLDNPSEGQLSYHETDEYWVLGEETLGLNVEDEEAITTLTVDLHLDPEACELLNGGYYVEIDGNNDRNALLNRPFAYQNRFIKREFSRNCDAVVFEEIPTRAIYQIRVWAPGIAPGDAPILYNLSVEVSD